MSDKVTLRGQLQTIRNNYALAQFGIALMVDGGSVDRFKSILAVLGDHPELKTFSYITYVFENDKLLKHATQEFRNSVLRNCLKEMFELVKAYADETNQSDVVTRADWYQFLRIVRNSLSHDMVLRFRPGDLKRLPVSWSGLTIDQSMSNQPLQKANFLTRVLSIALMDSVIAYVEQHVI